MGIFERWAPDFAAAKPILASSSELSAPNEGRNVSCLVLGASGKVGRLLRAGCKLAKPANINFRFQSRHSADITNEQDVYWDWSDRGLCVLEAQIGNVDVVLNLAGVTREINGAAFEDNVSLAKQALLTARKLGATHLFQASSSAIYGSASSGDPMQEQTQPRPLSAYGRSKVEMENTLLGMAEGDETSASLLRIGNVAGADQLLVTATGLQREIYLHRFQNGDRPQRSYIGAVTLTNVIQSLIQASRQNNLPSIVNVAAPGIVSMDELLTRLKACGFDFRMRDNLAPKEAIPKVQLDTDILEKLHVFSPQDSSAKEMVAQFLACRKCHDAA